MHHIAEYCFITLLAQAVCAEVSAEQDKKYFQQPSNLTQYSDIISTENTCSYMYSSDLFWGLRKERSPKEEEGVIS